MSRIIKSVSIGKKPVVIVVPEQELPIEPVLPADSDAGDPIDDTTEVIDSVAVSEELINKARQEADEIIASARKQAETLQAETVERCEEIKREAYDQGLQQGHSQGMTQAQESIDKALVKSKEIIAAAKLQAIEALVAAERQMIDISIAIARKILNREIEENPALVLPLIKAALERVHDQDKVTIRVSNANLELVQMAKTEFQSMLSSDSSLNIIGDDGLKEGDCIIETPFGIVDARIDTQYEAIKSVLRDVGHDFF